MAALIDYAELLRLRSAGLTSSQIAARLGCSASSVVKAAKKFGLEPRQHGPRGQQLGLSTADIHRMWVRGVPAPEIARQCGVSLGTLYAWSKRLKLPPRPRPERNVTADPSPDEIERLKAELKARHIAERVAEDASNTHSKVSKWRAKICNPR